MKTRDFPIIKKKKKVKI